MYCVNYTKLYLHDNIHLENAEMYVIVISRARGMYDIYCTEAQGRILANTAQHISNFVLH